LVRERRTLQVLVLNFDSGVLRLCDKSPDSKLTLLHNLSVEIIGNLREIGCGVVRHGQQSLVP
jgi:hypothetical protein